MSADVNNANIANLKRSIFVLQMFKSRKSIKILFFLFVEILFRSYRAENIHINLFFFIQKQL